MRVGVASQHFTPTGGTERYAAMLVDACRALGWTPAVFASRFHPAMTAGRDFERVLIRSRWLPRRWREEAFARRVAARRARLRLDAVIGCSRCFGAETLVCGGTRLGLLAAAGRAPSSADRRKIDLERRCFHAARVVAAHSELMAEEVRALYGVPPERVRTLYPAVDAARFRPAAPDERRRRRAELGWPPDRAVFVFPSFAHERKGLPILAAAFARTRAPATLVVAGRAPKAASANVAYAGRRDDMVPLYQAADAAILASDYEPFGLVGVEAVLCGTPAVMPRHIGVAEVLDSAQNALFDRDDPASLDAAIEAVAERALAGGDAGRVAEPLSALRYDPDPARHLAELVAAGAGAGH